MRFYKSAHWKLFDTASLCWVSHSLIIVEKQAVDLHKRIKKASLKKPEQRGIDAILTTVKIQLQLVKDQVQICLI